MKTKAWMYFAVLIGAFILGEQLQAQCVGGNCRWAPGRLRSVLVRRIPGTERIVSETIIDHTRTSQQVSNGQPAPDGGQLSDSSGSLVPTPAVVAVPPSPILPPAPAPAALSLAQQRAEIQASQNRMYHVGSVTWNGYEGVAFSSTSADHAIRSCCYWGQRRAFDIGVARGRLGWFACVRYW